MRQFMRSAALIAFPVAAGLQYVSSAQAQSMDYSGFEQLFGEPVTTSATGKPQRASEAPVNIDIITADQIANSGARSIPDVLRYVAGIDVRQYGEQDAAVGIRGYDTPLNPRVLVLLDGQQVYQDDYGLTVWATIPVALDEIQQIEIIKGPNAALFGFNAVSGVINIITRDPLHKVQNVASAAAGTQNQTYSDLVTTVGKPGEWAVRLAAQGLRSTEFDGDDASSDRQQPHSGMVSVDSRFQVARPVEWDVFGAISSLDSDYFTELGGYSPVSFRSNFVRTRVAYDSPVGLVHLDAYRNEERTADTAPEEASNWREDITVVSLSDLMKVGPHVFRVAEEYRNNDVASQLSFRGHVGYEVIAESAMWEWTLAPWVQLTNAVRLDTLFLGHSGPAYDLGSLGVPVHDTEIVEPSFNNGVVIKIDDRDTLRVAVARAAQLPSLIDFGLAVSKGPIIVSGNSSLTPSVETNYELDWDRSLPALLSTLRVATFAQHTEATIGSPFGSAVSFLPTGQIVLIARNYGNSDEAGGEISFKGKSSVGLRWNLSYALAAVKDRSSEAELADTNSANYQRQTPTNVVIAGLGYHWRKLDLDLQTRWQSRYQDFRVDPGSLLASPVTISNYITMRLHAAYQITRSLSSSFTADQFNRRQLSTTAGLPVDRQFVAGLRASF